MSQASTHPAAVHEHGEHPPHLAHHFDTPRQQFESGKVGMWVFLATEILMFGGLFCAYAVYRHNHPEVFQYASTHLSKILGGINTIVLIASSFTMAWAVRLAQLNKRRGLIVCLTLTLLGGFGFMGIKAVEYNHKWHDKVWFGEANVYRQQSRAEVRPPEVSLPPVAAAPADTLDTFDPNAGTSDESKVRPHAGGPRGLASTVTEPEKHAVQITSQREKSLVATFFGIYFGMTGLHGLHVLIGMSLIFWILVRACSHDARPWVIPMAPVALGLFVLFTGIMTHSTAVLIGGGVLAVLGAAWLAAGFIISRNRATTTGDFSTAYYAPVDLVGLYWHLVDLIWIFLFPLLYLIH